MKDLLWVSGEYGEVGFLEDGDVRCYFSLDLEFDGVFVFDEDIGMFVEDDIVIVCRCW